MSRNRRSSMHNIRLISWLQKKNHHFSPTDLGIKKNRNLTDWIEMVDLSWRAFSYDLLDLVKSCICRWKCLINFLIGCWRFQWKDSRHYNKTTYRHGLFNWMKTISLISSFVVERKTTFSTSLSLIKTCVNIHSSALFFSRTIVTLSLSLSFEK